MTSINIYSPSHFPFGMLSHLYEDDEPSILEQTYKLLFDQNEQRGQLATHTHTIYTTAFELLSDMLEKTFTEAAVVAVIARLKRDPELMELLNQTRGTDLLTENNMLAIALYKLRDETLVDPVSKQVISNERLSDVSQQVEQALMAGKTLSDDMSFLALEQMFPETLPWRAIPKPYLVGLASLVVCVKQHLGRQIHAHQVAVFKSQLLDVMLNSVLYNNYPHVPTNKWAAAKTQQKLSASVLTYENLIYTMFLNGEITPPFLRQVSQKIDDTLLNYHPAVTTPYTIDLPKQLDIYFMKPFIFRQVSWSSPEKFALYRVFRFFSSSVTADQLDRPTDVLLRQLTELKTRWIQSQVTKNFPQLAAKKFSDVTMFTLLSLAPKIVWGDAQDPVLGGAANWSGQVLSAIKQQKPAIPFLWLSDEDATLNPFTKFWFQWRVSVFIPVAKHHPELFRILIHDTDFNPDVRLPTVKEKRMLGGTDPIVWQAVLSEYMTKFAKQPLESAISNAIINFNALEASGNKSEQSLSQLYNEFKHVFATYPRGFSSAKTLMAQILTNHPTGTIVNTPRFRVGMWRIAFRQHRQK